MEVLTTSEFNEEIMYLVHIEGTWMDPIVWFLDQGVLSKDKAETSKLLQKLTSYILHHGALYKRSYLVPWLKCITLEEREQVLEEIHGLLWNPCGGSDAN